MNLKHLYLTTACLLALTSCGKDENEKSEVKKETTEVKSELKKEGVEAEPHKADEAKTKELKKEKKRVIAKFEDGTQITMDQLLEQIEKLPKKMKAQPFDKLYEALLNRLVDAKLLLDIAKKENVQENPEIKAAFGEVNKAVIQKSFLDVEVAKILKDDELKRKYEELKKKVKESGQKEVNLRQIIVKTMNEAKDIIKKLEKDPAQFEKIALDKSIDPQVKANKGNLGFIKPGTLPKEFFKLAIDTKDGGVLKQPIDLGGAGFSVIQVVEKRTLVAPSFDDVRDQLYKAIMPEYGLKVMQKVLKDESVELFDLKGQPLPLKMDKDKKPADDVEVSSLKPELVLAKFKDGHTITLKDLREFMKKLPPQLQSAPLTVVYEPLLRRLVDSYILEVVAKRGGYHEKEEVKSKVVEAKSMLLQKYVLDKAAKKKISEKDIKAKYQELLKLLPKDDLEFRLRAIFVKTEDEAKDILKGIKSGKKFDTLVQEKSIDDRSKENKGEIGYVKKSELPKPIATVINKAAKATLIKQPVKFGQLGWAVIRVEDKRPVTPPSMNDVKAELQRVLMTEKSIEVLKSIREGAKVKKFDSTGKELKEKKKD